MGIEVAFMLPKKGQTGCRNRHFRVKNFFFPYVGGVRVSVLFLVQDPVVQKLDSAIHRLNH